MVGLCLVYGVSGFLLNRIDKRDPSYKVEQHEITLAKGLSEREFRDAWQLEADLPSLNSVGQQGSKYRLLIDGGIGEYDPATGIAGYETNKRKPLAFWINQLHYNRVGGWSIMADLFAIGLIFFAISGLFMVRGKRGIAGRGKWFLIIGLLIPIAYILLAK
jgi:hypothetical protein